MPGKLERMACRQLWICCYCNSHPCPHSFPICRTQNISFYVFYRADGKLLLWSSIVDLWFRNTYVLIPVPNILQSWISLMTSVLVYTTQNTVAVFPTKYSYWISCCSFTFENELIKMYLCLCLHRPYQTWAFWKVSSLFSVYWAGIKLQSRIHLGWLHQQHNHQLKKALSTNSAVSLPAGCYRSPLFRPANLV